MASTAKRFSTVIRKARIQRNLSQKDLADIIGVSTRTLQNYETGARYPNSSQVFKKLCQVLNLSSDKIIEDDITARFALAKSTNNNDNELVDVLSIATTQNKIDKVVADIDGLFAGGELTKHDKEALVQAVMDAYFKSNASQ